MDLPEVSNYYEMMLILKADMPEETRGVVRRKVEDYITESGGSISNIEVWGKRPFAYEIEHMKEGYYLLYFFHLNPLKIKRMEKNMRVDENVVRFKVFHKELPTLTPAKAEAVAPPASVAAPVATPAASESAVPPAEVPPDPTPVGEEVTGE